MVRAKKVFKIDEMYVITQAFHINRALFLANNSGIEATGIIADRRNYIGLKYLKFRESVACIKAVLEVIFKTEPKFLGEPIPITGLSSKSNG